MTPLWQILSCTAPTFAAAACGAMLTAMSTAIAAFRFSSLKADDSPTRNMSAAAKFCIYNSDKIAAVVSLGRRFMFAIETVSIYFILDAVAELIGAEHSMSAKLCAAIGAAVLALFVQYSFFDLPAARFGRNSPSRTLSLFAKPMYAVYIFLIPLDFLSRALCSRLFGKKFGNLAAGFSYIDVEIMLRAEENDADSITPYTGKIVNNAFRLQELDVSDVMIPRSQVVFLDTDADNDENMELARNTRHTRYPLCKSDLDNCCGIIHIKDIFTKIAEGEPVDFMKLRRQTMRLRDNEKVEDALVKLLKYRLHMALVEDEFGGVIGVLTLDSALGELVGEIRDEFDADSDNTITVLGRNKYKIKGLATIRKVEDFLDVDFDNDGVSTFGGLITEILGRFPERGERIKMQSPALTIVVDDVDDRSVRECTVVLADDPKPDED